MWKKFLLCSVLIFSVVLGSTAFAGSPYASILMYNQNNGSSAITNIQTLGNLDVINMTP